MSIDRPIHIGRVVPVASGTPGIKAWVARCVGCPWGSSVCIDEEEASRKLSEHARRRNAEEKVFEP